MNKLASLIIRCRGLILALFIVLSLISGYLATKVQTNFDLSSYLPKDVASTVAIETMMDEYQQDIPNVEVGIPDLTISEALEAKASLAALPFVKEVLWLDDQLDLAKPLDLHDQKVVEGFYKEGMALYHITVDEDAKAQDVLTRLQELAGPDGAVRGQVVETAHMQRAITLEITRITLIAVPIALIILLAATKSWFEPALFLIVIFVGVLLNMGTNVIFKDVSFITQAVGSILQLAVSMDYAIFLLHRFSDYREEGYPIAEAMKMAIVKSFAPILSSALTTFFGFLMLIFMRFRIGPDLGIVLAKGVLFSLFSVFILLPVLAVYTYKLIDKTTHRSFLPSFKGFSRLVAKIGIPLMIAAALVIVPAYIGQRSNHFLYGAQTYPQDSREARDAEALDARFGENMQMVLLVPKGEWAAEEQLAEDLLDLPQMKSVVGYVTQVGNGIPPDLLPDRLISALISDHYSRMILIAESPAESPETYELAETIRAMADQAYPDQETHLAGANFVLLDMKTTINQDLSIVNGLAILAIALVIMLTFRSLALPALLVLTIELSVWINLAIPYLTGTPLNFIGYLVISTVQLGATVDYGILMAQHYMDHRRLLNRKEAAMRTVQTVAGSIIPPALILASAGFVLSFVSSISVVSELGGVLGRGALTSLVMVLFLLPNLLRLFDRFIEKTTMKVQFLPDPHSYRRQSSREVSVREGAKDKRPAKRYAMNAIRIKKRKRSGRKAWARSITGFLLLALFLSVMPGLVQADRTKDLVIFTNGDTSKREVVYAKLTASGEVSQIYVVNHFHPKRTMTLTDHGDYSSVIQLTGSTAPQMEGDQVTLQDVLGPYYYQGNMKSRDLPWLFDITYRLDGEKQSPRSLSGAAGHLEMELAISRNPAMDPSFFNHYALQISIPVDPERALIEAASEGFLVSTAGTEHQLNYIVLPGQETVIRLVMEVQDFAMGQITLAGVLLSFDLDLSSMDDELEPLDQLSEGIAEFAKGAAQLKAGYRDLMQAFKEIKSGAGQLADGGQDLDQGVQLLRAGARTLLSEGQRLKSGSQEILDGLTMVTDQLPDADVFEGIDIPEFGPEDLERLEGIIEFLELLRSALQVMSGYEQELEQVRVIMQELIALIRDLDLPEQADFPDTAQGWKDYLEGDYGLPLPLPDDVYEQLAALTRLSNDLGLISQVLDSLFELLDGMVDLDMDTAAMLESLDSLLVQAEQIMGLISMVGPMFSQFGELIDGLNQLQQGYQEFHGGLTRYIDEGVGGLVRGLEGTEGSPGLAPGTSDYVQGVTSLKDGLDQYYSQGMVRFAGGLNQLSAGAALMSDETGDLRTLFEEAIEEKLAEFSNEGFVPVSFVSSLNREVSSLQFVLMTEEIPPAR